MKTKKRPKITLAYCKRLFKKHDVKGAAWQEMEDNTASPEITPELLVKILKEGDENTYFYTSLENECWYDRDGDERDGRFFLLGSFLDDRDFLETLQEDENCDDSQPPFYPTKEAADHDRDALNRIVREHFGFEPKERTPEYAPAALVNKLLLGGDYCCPMCGSADHSIVSIEHESPSVVIDKCSCDGCHAEWEDVYTIKTYRNLRIP